MKVKFIKEADGIKKGSTKDLRKQLCYSLVEQGIAEFVSEKDQKVYEEKKALNAKLAEEQATKVDAKRQAESRDSDGEAETEEATGEEADADGEKKKTEESEEHSECDECDDEQPCDECEEAARKVAERTRAKNS